MRRHNSWNRFDACETRRPIARVLAAAVVGSLLAVFPGSQVWATLTCSTGPCSVRTGSTEAPQAQPPLRWAAKLEYIELMGGEPMFSGSTLTLQEYSVFGGIGAVVCQYDGQRRTSTAFLVGRFDVAVTVAHVFAHDGRWITPKACYYANVGPAGQVRERIPISSIKTQWQGEPETYGKAVSDLAVLRLALPVRLAIRTMSLTRFAYAQAPVYLVGFRSDLGAGALKRKSRGRVFPYPGTSCVPFTHDVDSRNIAPGAPLIDVRDNVVIGIHTRLGKWLKAPHQCRHRGNAMIVMSEWLERTLRTEIASKPGVQFD